MFHHGVAMGEGVASSLSLVGPLKPLDRWSADDDGFVSLSSLLSSIVDAHHCGVG